MADTSVLDSLTAAAPTAGMQAKTGTSLLDSLPAAQPSSGMMQGQAADKSSSWGDLGTQLWTGVKQGVAGMANAPLTLLNAEGDLIKGAINSGAGKEVVPQEQPIAGLPMPQGPEPKDFAGRAARAIGSMAPTIPLGGAMGGGSVLGGMTRQVAPTIAGAVTGQALEEVAPESLKPAAAFVGNLAGAGGIAAGQEALAGVGRAAGRQAGMMGIGGRDTVGGVKATPTQIQAAGEQVSSALGQEGEANLTAGPWGSTPPTMVPGSQPTTAQVAQTPGIIALDKAHRVANPDPFIERAGQQNTARLGAVQSLAPADANPTAVGDLFRQQLDAIDQAGQGATAAARGGVQQATEGLGGQGATDTYGSQIRGALQSAKAPVDIATRRLWAAVDPDGTWALPTDAVQTTARGLAKEISPTAQTDPQEIALLARASALPDVAKFSDLGQMRADINAAMRRLSGTPGYDPNIRRLTLLKQGIDQSIGDAVNGRAAQEAQAVSAGQMAPEQTVEANLQRQVDQWRAARNAIATTQTGAGGNPGAGSIANGRMGTSSVPGASGAENAATGRSGAASGNPGLPGEAQPLEPSVTPENIGGYQQAVAGTAASKQRFGQGGVGQVLRPGKQGAEFAVQEGAVPAKIFTRGPTEPGDVERFITAVGGPEQATAIGRETLANELRQTGVINPDGTINADRFATWQARRQPTIQQFPGLGDQFANAETAQRTLDDATAAHQQALKDFQDTAAAKFANNEPGVAVRSAFASGNPTATFQQLVQQMRGSPDALNGLKRAVVDYITEKTRSATPANDVEDFQKAATFRTFIRQNSGPLKVLFGGQGMQNLDMVAADLRRQAQQTTATAGSPTAEKLVAGKKFGLMQGGISSTALAIIGEKLGEHAGALAGHGVLGAAVGAAGLGGGFLIHALRQSGIATVNDLVREAMLHPNVARELVARAQNGRLTATAGQRIARAMQATLVPQSANDMAKQ